MSSYPLLDVFLTMLWFFLWVLWIFLVIWVLIDVFRNDKIGGWGKAGWTVLVVFLPLIGVLIYTVIHGQEMTERGLGGGPVGPEETYGSTTTSSELSKLADLHDQGVISDEEFARGKEKILH
jgi:hypothetical protein